MEVISVGRGRYRQVAGGVGMWVWSVRVRWVCENGGHGGGWVQSWGVEYTGI